MQRSSDIGHSMTVWAIRTRETIADASGNGPMTAIWSFMLTPLGFQATRPNTEGRLTWRRVGGWIEIDVENELPLGNDPRTLTAWIYLPFVTGDAKFLHYGTEENGRSFDFTMEYHEDTPHIWLRHWGGNIRYPGAIEDEWMHFAARRFGRGRDDERRSGLYQRRRIDWVAWRRPGPGS